MAVPSIKLLKKNPLEPYACEMCREVSRRNKFRECAYRETYGTIGMKTAKQKRLLEEKEIN